MGSLVWFRSDLRVGDNPALDAAVKASPEKISGLFIATPVQWRLHDWGSPKIDFVARSVEALADDLARRGIRLRVETCPSFDDVATTVLRIAREMEASRVFVNRELEVNERRRDGMVENLLSEHAIEWAEHDDQTIVPTGALRKKAGGAYTVFTPFFRAWVGHLDRHGVSPPLSAPTPSLPRSDGLVDRTDWPAISRAEGLRQRWPAGEAEARRRVDQFLGGAASRYHENRDDPGRESTSELSPYLATGAVSPRTLLWGGLEANDGRLVDGNPGIVAWLRQLAWRDFYRHVLDAFPRVSMGRPFRLDTESVPWREDGPALDAWKKGRTGFPIVDAAMRALESTGWLHNRLRMIVASFLAKDLLIDWREGERHFMNRLVDADLANNNGGWQWAASTGTDATPYFRIFNPWRQSRRFDPDGLFIRRFLPELADVPPGALHDPDRLSDEAEAADYPPPIVDHGDARRRALAAFRAE